MRNKNSGHPAPNATQVTHLSLQELGSLFESVGDNCEFGLFQRYIGAEPLGLFRFSSCSIENLSDLLEAGLKDYGGDDLEVFVNPGTSEYLTRSKRYNDFVSHTNIFDDREPLEKVLSRERMKAEYLKRRFLDELTSGDKVFVRKRNGGESADAISRLHRIIRKYGENTLLWVVEETENHPSGTVEFVERGLLKGYIHRFAPYTDAHDIDPGGWLKMCRTASERKRSMSGQSGPTKLSINLIRSRKARWRSTHDLKSTTGSLMPLRLLERYKHKCITFRPNPDRLTLARCKIRGKFDTEKMLVFSTAILILGDCSELSVRIEFTDNHHLFSSSIETIAAGAWQTIWASIRPSAIRQDLTAELKVRSPTGGKLLLAPGTLEEGYLPNEIIRSSA